MATVGSILEGAFGLIRRRPGAVAIWGLTYLIGSMAIGLLMVPLMGGLGMPVDPTQPPSVSGGFFGGMLLIYFLYLLLSIVLINAVYRAILRPRDTGFASMRVGGDEFRMLGLTLLFFVGMLILYFISLFGMMILGGIVGLAAGNSSGFAALLGIVLGLGYIGFWIWLWVRLSLIFPMTFYRRRFAIDEGWALGRGRFWTMFLAYLVVWVIVIVVAFLCFWSTFADLFAAVGANRGDPLAGARAMEAVTQGRQGAGMVGMVVGAIIMSVVSLLGFVLGYGVVGSAARELLDEQGDVSEEDVERTAQIFE